MTDERITAVAALSQKLASAWPELVERISKIENNQNIRLDPNIKLSNTSSLTEIDTRIRILLPILGALQPAEQSIVAPRALVDGLLANLTKIERQIHSVDGTLNRIGKEGGYGNIDPTQILVMNKNNKISLNLNEQAKQIQTIRGTPQLICKIRLQNIPEEGIVGLELPELVDRIIIGSSDYASAMREAFDDLLASAGVEDSRDRLHVSTIPLR